MEQLSIQSKLIALFQKYKYAVLIVIVGILLMLLPGFNTGQQTQNPVSAQPVQTQAPELRLKTILSQVKGAGRVEVMLTEASGQETVYQTDKDLSGEQSRHDTVIVSDSQRSETGLISQVNPPVYLGAVVVCDGADDPTVRLNIVEAVSKATGLGADKISVLKMK